MHPDSAATTGSVMEVPQPTEPATPVVPGSPVTPIDPDPGTPADPERPATVPGPDEPATPVVPEPQPGESYSLHGVAAAITAATRSGCCWGSRCAARSITTSSAS